MAKRKKSHHRRKTRRHHKGLFGIGSPGGAGERILGALTGALVTKMAIGHAPDRWDKFAPLIAIAGGGWLAYNDNDSFMGSFGLGAAIEGGLMFAQRHGPDWMCGIGEDKMRTIEAKIAKEIEIGKHMDEEIEADITVGEMGGGAEWGGGWN
jgi:hypothetical protein